MDKIFLWIVFWFIVLILWHNKLIKDARNEINVDVKNYCSDYFMEYEEYSYKKSEAICNEFKKFLKNRNNFNTESGYDGYDD